MDEKTLARFRAKITVDAGTGCWLWTGGARDKNGYGTMKAGGKTLRAHRVSYAHFVGPIPVGMLVCHTCDTPPCVNPDHLWLGTNRQNLADRNSKGRQPRLKGARNGKSKLRDDVVREIRDRAADGCSQSCIARRVGVSQQQVGRVLSGAQWAHAK